MKLKWVWGMLSATAIVGCAKQPAPAVVVDPVARAVSSIKLRFENHSRFGVSMSPWVGNRMGGGSFFGKREELQPGPEFTVSSSTLSSLIDENVFQRERSKSIDSL